LHGTKPKLHRFGSTKSLEEPMKMLRCGVAIGLLAALGACSNMMGSTSGSGSRSTAMTQPVVAPDMVRQVQSKLRDDGYYKQGPVDGVWGSGTETAVRSYQHDHNLTSNGQLDVPTLQALNLTGGSSTNYSTSAPATQPGNTNTSATQPGTTNPDTHPDTATAPPPR
jgi:peptidoglycan hydrolase-like protein with peptidoglycan-binding domain